MITVKHKKGKHYPNLYAIVYCYLKLLFVNRVYVTIEFDEFSKFTVDKPTYFKVCGWKSKLKDGALDKTVRENLLAYLNHGTFDRIMIASYQRHGIGLNRIDDKLLALTSIEKWEMNRNGMFFPAFPWAGGNAIDESPNNDFQYRLEISWW